MPPLYLQAALDQQQDDVFEYVIDPAFKRVRTNPEFMDKVAASGLPVVPEEATGIPGRPGPRRVPGAARRRRVRPRIAETLNRADRRRIATR